MARPSSPTLPDYTPEAPRDCPRCPRLVAFRNEAAQAQPSWFNGAVPSFGNADARLLVVGLAPGLRGPIAPDAPSPGTMQAIFFIRRFSPSASRAAPIGPIPTTGFASSIA